MPDGPLLQLVASWSPEASGFALELARALGGSIVSFTCPPEAAAGALPGGIVAPEPGESALATWHRALNSVRPGAVFVQELGGLNPAFLLDLRERGTPYAVFLHGYTALCPTHRLWHRREELCSGPGRTGWKCAWCAAPEGQSAAVRAAGTPLRFLFFRHRPQNWRTALSRADALLAPSRFARDFWIEQGAPPERIALFTPLLPGADRSAAPPAARGRGALVPPPAPGRLLLPAADAASGFDLVASALDAIRPPQRVVVAAGAEPRLQTALRGEMAPRHKLHFDAAARPGSGDIAVFAARWDPASPRSLLEAQRAGAVVVVSAAGAYTECVIHGVNGFLAGRGDPAALAEALAEAGRQVANPPGESAWAGSRIQGQVAAAAEAGLNRLRDLLDLLRAGDPEPALQVAQGQWLAERTPASPASAAADRDRLIAALRDELLSDDDALSRDRIFRSRARALSRSHRLALNHAIAFFRACGCRRIVQLTSGPEPSADAVAWFAAWGIETVLQEELPDGILVDREFNLDAESVHPGEQEILQRRFPQAKAWVDIGGEEVETQAWP